MTISARDYVNNEKEKIQNLNVTQDNAATAITNKIYSLYAEQDQQKQHRILQALGFNGQIDTLDPTDVFMKVQASLDGCSDLTLKNVYVLPPSHVHLLYDRAASQQISLSDSLESFKTQWTSIELFDKAADTSPNMSL